MNTELYFIKKGKGFSLILLHGNGESHEYFKNQIEYFSKDYCVFAIDTRGHGKSQRGTAPFTISQFALDLKKFMDSQGIERAVILGFSDGANIAMKFALEYPKYVAALILNGGNLSPRGVKFSVQFPIEIGYRISKLLKKDTHKTELLGLMVNEPNIKPGKLSAISAPTLVIAGTADMIKEKETKKIAQMIDGSELVFIKGSHFIAAENPSEFNHETEKFLNKIKKILT